MAEYINRETLINNISEIPVLKRNKNLATLCEEWANSVPTADVRENVRGEWDWGDWDIAYCSVCRYETEPNQAFPFCPNCGADMRMMAEYEEFKKEEFKKKQAQGEYVRLSFKDFIKSLDAEEITFINYLASQRDFDYDEYTFAVEPETVGNRFVKFINKLHATRVSFDSATTKKDTWVITDMETDCVTQDIHVTFSKEFLIAWSDFSENFDIVKRIIELK